MGEKGSGDQTWANVNTYFTELYQSQTQYSKSLAKRKRFHENTSNITEKENEKEENDATVMFAMIQEHHQDQLNAMRESNTMSMKTAYTEMAEMANHMQFMMAAMPDKPGCVQTEPKMCSNCKRVVYHKPDKFLELKANK